MKFPVFDLHCDTSFALLENTSGKPCSLRENSLHIDLNRAKVLPAYAQCFACFTSTALHYPEGTDSAQLFSQEIAVFNNGMAENADIIRQASSAEDILHNREQGLMSGILTIEGPAGFDFDPDRLEELYKLGFRITTLGWNEQNPLAGSHVTGGGLTDRGRRYVQEAQRLGMIIDVSHVSDEAFWDIMKISYHPVIASHSNSRKVWNVSRNLTDEMYLALCDCGGLTGINLYSEFLGENADLDTVCNHILHFISLRGDHKHIALGGDLDGCESLPAGFCGIEDYPRLADKLLDRGLQELEVLDIFWNNALGVMKQCCM